MFIYFWERETEHKWLGVEREGDTESELSTQSPTQGSNPQTERSWPEPKADAQPTEPPGLP